MLWGYIAPRYLGDFVPFLVLASAVAMVDICRRLDGRRRSVRTGAWSIIAAAWLSSPSSPTSAWPSSPTRSGTPPRSSAMSRRRRRVSDITGHPLNADVVRGRSLPAWGPAGQLYVIGNCDGLYISNGEDYSTVPSEQFTRTTWMTVELGQEFQHTFRITTRSPASGRQPRIGAIGHTRATGTPSRPRRPPRVTRIWSR